MSLFRIAAKNIRKSSRDYSVYFMTLVLGIALFYIFNSIGSQDFMETIVSSGNSFVRTFVRMIEAISVGVAVILGILIAYANNFLIRRRKKEFGVYRLLGMSERKVAGILSAETFIVGIVSLVMGLLCGVFGSQLLSVIVIRLFAADVSAYRFTMSAEVIVKTVVYFAVIFVSVMIFNVRTLAKYSLIDLLNAGKKAEKKLIGNPAAAVVLFVLSILLLGFGYIEVGFRAAVLTKYEFIASIAAGLAGTFLLFASLSGFLPGALAKRKNFYHRGLNSFVVSQFGNNLGSSVAAFSLISLMLFLSICAFSVGFSMNGYLNRRLADATPVDVTANAEGGSICEQLKKSGCPADTLLAEYVELPIYNSPSVTMGDSVGKALEEAKQVFFRANWDAPENIVRLSDYNRLERLYGRKPLTLGPGEYAEICDYENMADLIDLAISRGNTFTIGGKELKSGYDAAVGEFVIMSGMADSSGVVVLPDEVIDSDPQEFTPAGAYLCGNYAAGKDDAAFAEAFNTAFGSDAAGYFVTKTNVRASNVSTAVSIVFIVLYIGIIFIITSAAVIALKILSDSMDSASRYDMLLKIGAGRKQREGALFAQLLLNFAAPLIPGLLHSVFALRYAKDLLKALGMTKMLSGSLTAVIIMLLVYGGYFLMTYRVCRRVVINE